MSLSEIKRLKERMRLQNALGLDAVGACKICRFRHSPALGCVEAAMEYRDKAKANEMAERRGVK